MKLVINKTIKFILLSVLLCHFILCSHTEINISERFLKYKKSSLGNRNKSTSIGQITKNPIQKDTKIKNELNRNKSHSTNGKKILEKSPISETELYKNEPTSDTGNNSENQDIPNKLSNIGNGPVYATGWINYFKYSNTASDKTPKSFFINGQFDQQYKLNPELKTDKKTFDGTNTLFKYIPNNYSFYAVLFKDSLNILSSRQVNKKTF